MTGFAGQFRRLVVHFTIVFVIVAAGAKCYAQQLPVGVPEALPDELEAAEEVEEIRHYSVELIVFEYSSTASGGNEIFTPEPDPAYSDDPYPDDFSQSPDGNVNDEGVIEFGDFVQPPDEDIELVELPTLADVGFRYLQPEERTMTAIYEKLDKLDAYKPVLWGGWSQAATGEDTTPIIRLRVLGSLPLNYDGTLTMYLKNYLHLVVDLTMQQQVAAVQPIYRQENHRQEKPSYGRPDSNVGYDVSLSEMQTFVYRISEDRIFGSGQMRYFDHPKFGVLARINRHEAEMELPDEDPDPDGPSIVSSIANE